MFLKTGSHYKLTFKNLGNRTILDEDGKAFQRSFPKGSSITTQVIGVHPGDFGRPRAWIVGVKKSESIDRVCEGCIMVVNENDLESIKEL